MIWQQARARARKRLRIDAPVVGSALALRAPASSIRSITRARPALADRGPAGELGHPQSALCLIEVDKGVVPAQRDLALRRGMGRRFDAACPERVGSCSRQLEFPLLRAITDGTTAIVRRPMTREQSGAADSETLERGGWYVHRNA